MSRCIHFNDAERCPLCAEKVGEKAAADAGPDERVIEEASELIHAICKARRFGWFNYHPGWPEIKNIDQVRSEMSDLIDTMERLDSELRQKKAAYYAQPTGRIE